MTHLDALRSEAVTWYLRLRSGSDADWDAFTVWLERDPAHGAAYDAVVAADDELTPDIIPSPQTTLTAIDPEPTNAFAAAARWAAVVAVVALIALVLLVMPRPQQPASLYAVATQAGEHRSVLLEGGTSVLLNGDSRLVLDRHDQRFAELERGEAMFSVHHDEAKPFVVLVGGHRIEDVGTVFNLAKDRDALRLDVLEGAVLYDPDGRALPVNAGHTLSVRGRERVLERRAPDEMASWRRGRLSYRDAMLESVAADLTRNLGVKVTVDPDLARLPFTGTIRIEQDPAATLPSVAALAGLQARRTAEGWLIERHALPPR